MSEGPNPQWLSWRGVLFSDGSLLLPPIGNIVPETDDRRSDGHDQRLGCMEGPDFAYEEEDLAAMEMADFQMDFHRRWSVLQILYGDGRRTVKIEFPFGWSKRISRRTLAGEQLRGGSHG
ncbi:hypothetical protein ACLOJK_002366 [Asimina triloba]